MTSLYTHSYLMRKNGDFCARVGKAQMVENSKYQPSRMREIGERIGARVRLIFARLVSFAEFSIKAGLSDGLYTCLDAEAERKAEGGEHA